MSAWKRLSWGGGTGLGPVGEGKGILGWGLLRRKVSILGCSMGGHWLEQARVWTPHCGGWQRLLSADLLLSFNLLLSRQEGNTGRAHYLIIKQYPTISWSNVSSNRLPERFSVREGIFTLVAFVWLFSTVLPAWHIIPAGGHIIKQYPHHPCTQFSFTSMYTILLSNNIHTICVHNSLLHNLLAFDFLVQSWASRLLLCVGVCWQYRRKERQRKSWYW